MVLLLVGVVAHQHRVRAQLLGEAGHDRDQVEEAVGHVEGDDPVGLHVAQIGAERLARDEVHRNRVAREGIDREHVEVLRRLALGDARLTLEREPPQNFDVLAVDAFSGDAIPVHLITYEAFTEYLRHLKPQGVIAFHVSNRFLDLKPVLLAIAEKHGIEYAFVHETGEEGGTTSDWVLITRHKPFILRAEIVEGTEPVVPRPDWNLWTDDFNNLLQVFRY